MATGPKLQDVVDAIVVVLEAAGYPLPIDRLTAEANQLSDSHFSTETLERIFLLRNPEKFVKTEDERWGMSSWSKERLSKHPVLVDEVEKSDGRESRESTEFQDDGFLSNIPDISVPLTPNQAFEHIKESIVQYLETAYRISDYSIYAERGDILRRVGSVAQQPFIESTPSFPTSKKLAELERENPKFLPSGLSELVQHGVPVHIYPLYTHQEESLLAAFSSQPNLLVATGTGSGKTEAFLLPILADILNEARSWPAPSGNPERGRYHEASKSWLHSRRHETRKAALRGIILYPMNALVNDQLARLRRILALEDSPSWQRRNLNGNVIHFGMYTSLTPLFGSFTEKWRRNKLNDYRRKVEDDWNSIPIELKEKGFWPRPDSPEMLNRWDMQAAPPDILVTNYSMLEYMLVRPHEYPIFEATRRWLQDTDHARMTLVLDEAHTYTGAKGTEVAHLVRRLKERLGLEPGSDKFRAIATTASLPDHPSAETDLRDFVSDLFAEPQGRFTLLRLPDDINQLPNRTPIESSLHAFERFHQTFDITEPFTAIDGIAEDLQLGQVDHTLEPQVALHNLLEKNVDITWVRQRTARKATLLSDLADECWDGLGSPEERERATAGILSAGSFSRSIMTKEVPPLLSVRLHAFFRGIPGLWACMDPDCSAVDPKYHSPNQSRSIGKLYTDPRPWCECGARVLELFSCRRCGLQFLGGIPDQNEGSLWPWSDDLSGERQRIKDFRIFGVERPHSSYPMEYRSTRTTLFTHPNDPFARPVYQTEPTNEDGQEISPFPQRCPRCQNYRAPGPDGREVIEPFRTKGPQSFSLVVEDGFRVQPRSDPNSPNYGRKALTFTDSRQEAAKLAADLRNDHSRDVFRQLCYLALYLCPMCKGDGEVKEEIAYHIGDDLQERMRPCPVCNGTGYSQKPVPLKYQDLYERVKHLQLKNGIIPSSEKFDNFFTRLQEGDVEVLSRINLFFDLALRRELAEDEYSLEPLGLASWRVDLPPGNLDTLTEEETHIFLRSIARLLATENILLPPGDTEPWAWHIEPARGLLEDYERQVLVWGYRRYEEGSKKAVPYNLSSTRKLGRYVIAVSKALADAGRLPNQQTPNQWVNALQKPLWNALVGSHVLKNAGARLGNDKVPWGIGIDVFQLHPIGPTVQRCKSCGYIMSETLLNVCVRCGQNTVEIQSSSIQNYYRRAAQLVQQSNPFDDPFPLRAIEHTAQIPGVEARDLERWFQDLFHENQHSKDHRIDVLSVTTTMEMGIDIGSLLCVGLRNIPPTVANYQQRAGRAGRRGSAIATVLSYAQDRSHDQYYFSRPPEIVSQPPRVPSLYIRNEVIAHRHMRALVLQDFFYRKLGGQQGSNLFATWGTANDFTNKNLANKFLAYLGGNRAPLLERCEKIIHPDFSNKLNGWLDTLLPEVQEVVNRLNPQDTIFENLINSGLLPKYAFPVDVVSLNIPSNRDRGESNFENNNDAMQRDLKIALSEYAPGAEVIRGEFPNTYIYKSAALYDPFEKNPNYRPQEKLVECFDCKSITILSIDQPVPSTCQECTSPNIRDIPYLRPPGFTVDWTLPNAGRIEFKGGGRELAGFTSPARLLLGQSAFAGGKSQASFAPRLFTRVQVGDLFISNNGPDKNFPGFLICQECGRVLDPNDPTSHTYPSNIPPHRGRNKGPRSGTLCPNKFKFDNQVILGYKFHSEVILLGVDLPSELDAPIREPSGRAIWNSFGTLVANASAIVLQVDPSELKVGVRPVRRDNDRIHGEVFLYDDIPGGAGYARAIQDNLQTILEKALELGRECPNPDCPGACYQCMYDYTNQAIHPLLDRNIATDVLRFVLYNKYPTITQKEIDHITAGFIEYARSAWEILPAETIAGHYLSVILQNKRGDKIGLWVTHPMSTRPSTSERTQILTQSGIRPAVHNAFDLARRPFWVLNNLTR